MNHLAADNNIKAVGDTSKIGIAELRKGFIIKMVKYEIEILSF